MTTLPDIVQSALKDFSPQRGDFDPLGQWRQSYRVWVWQSAKQCRPEGEVTLTRAPSKDGMALRVENVVGVKKSVQRATAELQCANDALSTPLSWTLRWSALDAKGHPLAGSAVKERGAFRDGVLTRGGRSVGDAPGALTCNWSLMEAAQRLPATLDRAVEFDMLEDMQALRREQRLDSRGVADVDLGGRKTRLAVYRRMGRGTLPCHYWVDERRRLLFVTGATVFLALSAGGSA